MTKPNVTKQAHLDELTSLVDDVADQAKDHLDILSTHCSDPEAQVGEALAARGLERETVVGLIGRIALRRRREMCSVGRKRQRATGLPS
jgi:hypothetical protein